MSKSADDSWRHAVKDSLPRGPSETWRDIGRRIHYVGGNVPVNPRNGDAATAMASFGVFLARERKRHQQDIDRIESDIAAICVALGCSVDRLFEIADELPDWIEIE